MTCEVCECPEWGESEESARCIEYANCEECAVWRCWSKKSKLANRFRKKENRLARKAAERERIDRVCQGLPEFMAKIKRERYFA